MPLFCLRALACLAFVGQGLSQPLAHRSDADEQRQAPPISLDDAGMVITGLWAVTDDLNKTVRIGDETFLFGEDGALMPSKPGQEPPDLRYFRPAQK